MKNYFLFALLFVFAGSVQSADVFCSETPIAAPDPNNPLCSVITDRNLTGSVQDVLTALNNENTESCKRDTMTGYEVRASVDELEYNGLDPVARSDFIALTIGGQDLNPYGFGEIAIRQQFGTGPTLAALSGARVKSISLNQLYGLNPRAIDVQECQGG